MTVDHLLTSLQSTKRVAGLTHNFYRYPARMSPELTREVIQSFSQESDLVLDPFMGGGTSIVEAVATGRQAIGIDLNPLAVFVTAVKTTPLSTYDQDRIRQWADEVDLFPGDQIAEVLGDTEPRARNLPTPVQQFLIHALRKIDILPLPRQQRFARCVLLRLGQWAVDCKTGIPQSYRLKDELHFFVDDMLGGLAQFVNAARNQGIAKNKLTRQRVLLLRSVVNAQHDPCVAEMASKPKLVITSPPYPGIHVLYHRWQVAGRRETPAPYWLINARDGNGAAYYTFGGRSRLGLQNYFQEITAAYSSVRAMLHPDALVVQLVAFSDTETQLPAFLEAMERAGYQEDNPIYVAHTDLWRSVPHRKWYNYIGTTRSVGQELLLFHKLQP